MIKDLFYEIMVRFTLRGPGVREGEPERNQDGRHEHVGESLAAGVRPGHVQWLVAVIIIVLKQQDNQKPNHRIALNNNECRMLGICNEICKTKIIYTYAFREATGFRPPDWGRR